MDIETQTAKVIRVQNGRSDERKKVEGKINKLIVGWILYFALGVATDWHITTLWRLIIQVLRIVKNVLIMRLILS